jgi:hypothetical protein
MSQWVDQDQWVMINHQWIMIRSRFDMMLVLKNYSKVQTQETLEVGHDHDDWLDCQCDTQEFDHCCVFNKV